MHIAGAHLRVVQYPRAHHDPGAKVLLHAEVWYWLILD
jgi:hypothetical protein